MRRIILREASHRDRALEAVQALGVGLNPPLCVEIKPFKENRSLDQNAAYHAVIQDIARHTGHSHDEIHEIVKFKFLPALEVELPDGEYRVSRSTTRLNRGEMSDLIDQVQAWAASLGVEVAYA